MRPETFTRGTSQNFKKKGIFDQILLLFFMFLASSSFINIMVSSKLLKSNYYYKLKSNDIEEKILTRLKSGIREADFYKSVILKSDQIYIRKFEKKNIVHF